LAAEERYGASVFTSMPAAGVLGKISWGEVGPQEMTGSTDIIAHAATAGDTRKRENMLQVRRTARELEEQLSKVSGHLVSNPLKENGV
jgi:hypothetical protein